MPTATSSPTGYSIEGNDGRIGAISDIPFDAAAWRTRSRETGAALSRRRAIPHPCAITALHPDTAPLTMARCGARRRGGHIEDQPEP
jgi:hypothetical protein